jgi:glycosyltransferase involved in cell wall biosynthesis
VAPRSDAMVPGWHVRRAPCNGPPGQHVVQLPERVGDAARKHSAAVIVCCADAHVPNRDSADLKILIVSAQFPYPPRSGFSTRVYQLARQLSARHEVTVLSYVLPHEREGVAGLAEQMSVRAVKRDAQSASRKRAVQALTMISLRPYYCRDVYSRDMQSAIDDLCSAQQFDIIQVETSFLCDFRFPADARLVVDEHNIESEVFRRMCEGERSVSRRAFNRIEYLRCRRFERTSWKRADACVVTSDRELPTVRACAPNTPVATVPNSVDLAYFAPSDNVPEPHSVVFNGILTYRPNVDAVRYLIDDIWPLVRARHPDAKLTLIGRSDGVDTRAMMAPGVELLGEVPDIRPYVHRAAIVAVPVRIGGGTRLKVVEGLAMGKPIVSTTLGCEGLAVRDGEHLLIGDDPAAFASRIFDVFENPQRSGDLGRAGRRLVEGRYSWDLAGERLEALYRRLTDEAAGHSIEPELAAAGG